MIHRVLEGVDFAAGDLDTEFRSRIEAELALRRIELGDPDAWASGLRTMIETPLGPMVDELAFRDFGRGDRLDEMDFELPLIGGNTPSGELSVVRHRRCAANPCAVLTMSSPATPNAWPTPRSTGPCAAISAAVSTWCSASPGRASRSSTTRPTASADRETTTPSAWHYRPAALTAEMYRAHYPLQALLYTVALHRYLRWRLPGYDPGRNLAGALYLFVRGMSSPAFPRVGDRPCGVWSWRPPPALVESLSDLFDRGRQR